MALSVRLEQTSTTTYTRYWSNEVSMGKIQNDTTDFVSQDENELDVKKVDSEEKGGKVKSDESIDDPVRMYLMQMGRIPLLSRVEEIDAAKKIDHARLLFRNSMLATDFMLRGAFEALQKVLSGELRLDRTIEVSVTNKAEKKRIMQRLVPNLKTLRYLMDLNKNDFLFVVDSRNSLSARRKNVAEDCGET